MSERPRPKPTPLTQGFWDAARRGELVVQRCAQCETYRHYPTARCTHCGSMAWAWSPISGRGEIYSFTVTYQAFHPAWSARVPYAVATVQLDHGVRMLSDLDEHPSEVRIGAPVEVFFDRIDDELTLPRFQLSG